MLQKCWEWFLMGLCFGIGFFLAQAAAHFIGHVLSSV